MNTSEATEKCRSMRGATEGYPFTNEALVFKVGGRIFAIFGGDTISLKCDPALALALREEYPASVKPGYHLSKRHWNTVSLDDSVADEDLVEWIEHSYELAVGSLTRAQRAALG